MNERETPLVSVITSTYKRFDSVWKTIDSLLMQDYPRIEYIITDDGSENFPEEAIRNHIENRPERPALKIIHHEHNLGTVRNLNNAYRAASGEYIVNLSAGDTFLSPAAVRRIAETMEKKSCSVLSTSRLAVSEDGTPLYWFPHRIFRGKLSRLTRRKQYAMFVSGQFYGMFSGSALAVRKSAFEKLGGFDERYRLWEDGPFVEKVLRDEAIGADYRLVTIGYEMGGVSTGSGNPLLSKDNTLYNQTDRIGRLNELSRFYRALTKINAQDDRVNLRNTLRHPAVMLYKLVYKTRNRIGMTLDRMYIRRNRHAFTETGTSGRSAHAGMDA